MKSGLSSSSSLLIFTAKPLVDEVTREIRGTPLRVRFADSSSGLLCGVWGAGANETCQFSPYANRPPNGVRLIAVRFQHFFPKA